MIRTLTVLAALAWVIAPAHALTEQDIVDQLGDDLAQGVLPLHQIVPTQQLSLTASLDLAGDHAQLSMNRALRALAADLAVASANLTGVSPEAAPSARAQYVTDLSKAVAKYEQATVGAYNEWTSRSAEVYQGALQNGAQGFQPAFQALAIAQQRAMQSLLGSDWGSDPPMVVPTLPDFIAKVNEDAERMAEAAALIAHARQAYLTDVNASLAACDDTLRAAAGMTDPAAMAQTMADALADLDKTTCARYQQYDTDVKAVLGALTQPCARNP
ncbi:MAG: hypothetical protein FJX75_23180 [Armatimonadetes bacterium]|nr:hypothetical protein [Armatimonadota bacterium]